jgi:hypothetical protein
MTRIIAAAALAALASISLAVDVAVAGPTPAPKDAFAYIGYPNNGQVVPANKPFRVWFGLRYMGVAPKGVKYPNTGHHHLLIDTDLPPMPMDQEIPSDRQHLHFGAGETETMIELPPGKHTLQLLMGDENHVPHNPPVYSKKITVIAK